MERMKIALLAVIAAALCLLVARDFVPVAHADSGTVECNAWIADEIAGVKDAKVLERSMAYVEPIREWLQQHPGQPVFRTTLVHNTNSMYIDIMCVR